MSARPSYYLCALSLLVCLAGCNGSSSEPESAPADNSPTTTGAIGGTIAPFVPDNPAPANPAPPQISPPPTSAPLKSVGPPKFSPMARFAKEVPAVQDGAIYMIEAGDYDLGSVIVSTADFIPSVFLARLHGGIWYPGASLPASTTTPAKYPIVIFLHGQHSPKVPNYQGYEYLARNLAAHGYVALSIDANDINAARGASSGDYTSQSRGQLILATLDKLKKINDGVQTTSGIALKSLVGKIDFDRIGIMGHSRGGQGINDAIQLNAQRIGVTLAQLRGAINNLEAQRDQWIKNVWFSAPGAIKTTGKKDDSVKMIDDLVNVLKRTPAASDADLLKTLDSMNITVAADNAAGSGAPPKYVFRAALSLAPTDGRNFNKIANVPFAAMVPTCDGDVTNLNGAHVFDRNRFSRDPADTAPRFQIAVRGANHNFFNSQWTTDDFGDRNVDHYCYLDSLAESHIRLAPADQVAIGLFIINSFMRNFVGGETAFTPYWNGSAPLPAKACPNGRWPCDSRVALTLQTNGKTNGLNNHKVIAPFDDAYGFNQLYDVATLGLHTGGALDLIDTSAFTGNLHACATDLTLDAASIPACSPAVMANTFFRGKRQTYTGGLVSAPNQLLLNLTKPDMPLTITLKEPVVGVGTASVTAEDLSTDGYDTLSFRIAMIRPALATEGPLPKQELTVMLTDSHGVESPVIKVSDFSDALDSSMGLPIPVDSRAAELQNMVAIPLGAFRRDPASGSTFDQKHLKTLTLRFSNAPNDGSRVALTDVQLQNFGRTLD